MSKKAKITLLLGIVSSIAFTGCFLPMPTEYVPVPPVNVEVPSISVQIPGPGNSGSSSVQIPGPSVPNDVQNQSNALPTQIQFEQVVRGKIFYSRLRDDGNYNQVYQEKLRFDVNSKTVTRERYYWNRVGYGESYTFAGVNVQTAYYYYTNDNNKLDFKVVEDYNIDSFNNRSSNNPNRRVQGAWFSVDNSEMITWHGKQYVSKQALRNQSVADYTTRRDFTR